MRARSWALLIFLGGVLSFSAWAKSEPAPPIPERNPMRQKTAAPAMPFQPKDAPTKPWSDAEIAAAKAACRKLLEKRALDFEPLPPTKEGLCGAPAPILVRSVGEDPKVVIDPPATLRCEMADTLAHWLATIVQPLAKDVLGSPVAKLSNAASYVCRNRYNGNHTPLSEHALANALDLSEFVLLSGEVLTVLDHWPKLTATNTPPLPLRKPKRPAPHLSKASVIKVSDRTTEVSKRRHAKSAPTPEARKPSEAAKASFLRLVHEGACEQFGTVLGPESNDAHKNHFHLDEKARRRSSYCE